MGILEFTIRLVTGMLLGSAIGIERHWRQKSAGLRTNTLVSLGATAFILLSIKIGGDATGRIASYIVSGIGFLGAGVIMKDGLNVQGLNTAATIWCSAAVGALSGMGLQLEAAVVTATVMLTHIILRPIGLQLNRFTFVKSHGDPTDYLFTIKCTAEVENHIRVLLMQMLGNDEKLLLKSLSSDDVDQNVVITAVIKTAVPQDSLIERTASRLTIEEKVHKVSWEIIGTQSEL
ncbi:magnesium transporter MgtC [Chryseobacterium piperi]|uniref:Protein MgtC n=1 Tax=Chryseobacterium piperi TaxID=558152 RepID=A0A086ALD7_9FLAO|nr:MgtC/SapB family protein [Chryseobacterium piperi]ASW73563.1 magnesium transporter MgtC [Chryseobacterium piperi]KFF17501.1 magnesium transporter MgtC [Chryseobacterium piperi]